ncbi:MAG: type VI secretion system tube protein Hcp [Psychroserpens sp.]|uniref:Hcp family type VI secretion system effector n=1 Tax=Psychroserpens sp. TaxID=2020870 RepID=UPI00300375D0
MKNISILISVIMILFCVGMSFAQSGFLKIGDIKGESTERAHKDWITIERFSQGIAPQRATTGTSRRRGIAVFEDLIITKKLDKSTPKLMIMCAKGEVVPKLELDMLASDGSLYYKVILNNVKISSISTSSICDPECKLVDEISISYSKITWEYWDSDGNKTVATYNVQAGN